MKKFFNTFTKIIVALYSFVFIVWVTWSYVLSTIGREQTNENLSEKIIEVGVAMVITYFLKSFAETRESERMKLKRELMYAQENNNEEMESVQEEDYSTSNGEDEGGENGISSFVE